MIKEIIDGISNALYANFQQVDIVSEGIEQGFTEPTFFIGVVETSEIPLLGNRAYRSMLFDIQYFPLSKNEPNNEIELTASKLYKILRRITLLDGDMLNGLRLNHKTEDGVLHFFVEYKPIVYYVGEAPDLQEEISYSVEVKNED